VHRCIESGESESPTVPLDETLTLMSTLDKIGARLDVVDPLECTTGPSETNCG
jgi:hypothetical protein